MFIIQGIHTRCKENRKFNKRFHDFDLFISSIAIKHIDMFPKSKMTNWTLPLLGIF